jgi:hypothetical protein
MSAQTRPKMGCFQMAAMILGLLIGIAGLIVAVVQVLPPDPPDGPPETTGKPPPKPGRVPNGRIVFSDDFGEASNAWWWGEQDDTVILHQPGEMRIIINKGLFQWNLAEPDGHALRLEDARVDVEITSLGEPGAYASILCRYQGRDDYYRFEINGDGTYEIFKQRAERWRTLVSRTAAPELNQERLRIQVACIGGPRSEPVRLMLWAGGKGLAKVTDTQQPLPPGEVAIGAGTRGKSGHAEVAFTRFALRQLTG